MEMIMQPRVLDAAELDAVSGGGSGNTINFLSGNGGISVPAISVNVLGGFQYASATSGSANGSATGSNSISNSGTVVALLGKWHRS